MRFLRFVVPACIAFSAGGCAPYLQAQAVPDTHAYASPVRCGQGPYELHATAMGSKWGESVALGQAGGQPVWVPEGITVRLDPGGWILGR